MRRRMPSRHVTVGVKPVAASFAVVDDERRDRGRGGLERGGESTVVTPAEWLPCRRIAEPRRAEHLVAGCGKGHRNGPADPAAHARDEDPPADERGELAHHNSSV